MTAATPCFASGTLLLPAVSLLGSSSPRANHHHHHHQLHLTKKLASTAPSRREISVVLSSSALLFALPLFVPASPSRSASPEFFELPNSSGVMALDLRIGSGEVPSFGDEVAIHYYGRLAAKQGWRFDSTYDHKDATGDSVPFVFKLGSINDWMWAHDPNNDPTPISTAIVYTRIQAAVKSMKVGGIRRVIIPPSQGYQSTSQEPIPPNFFDRQRLFTTLFNPTRLGNGEGSTLGTLIFDIEFVNLRRQ